MTIFDRAQERATKNLIHSFPSEIALRRLPGEMVRTPAGGVSQGTGRPIALESKERFFSAVTQNPFWIETQNGERVIVTYVLVGLKDDDIQAYDEFVVGGRTFWVVKVDPTTLSYQTKAWCAEK